MRKLRLILMLLAVMACNNLNKPKDYSNDNQIESRTKRWMAFHFKYSKSYELNINEIINLDSNNIKYKVVHIYNYKNKENMAETDTAIFMMDSLFSIQDVKINKKHIVEK